jgi:hypothetical protein
MCANRLNWEAKGSWDHWILATGNIGRDFDPLLHSRKMEAVPPSLHLHTGCGLKLMSLENRRMAINVTPFRSIFQPFNNITPL